MLKQAIFEASTVQDRVDVLILVENVYFEGNDNDNETINEKIRIRRKFVRYCLSVSKKSEFIKTMNY